MVTHNVFLKNAVQGFKAQPSKETKEVDSPLGYCGSQHQRKGIKTLVYMKKYEFNIILGIVTLV